MLPATEEPDWIFLDDLMPWEWLSPDNVNNSIGSLLFDCRSFDQSMGLVNHSLMKTYNNSMLALNYSIFEVICEHDHTLLFNIPKIIEPFPDGSMGSHLNRFCTTSRMVCSCLSEPLATNPYPNKCGCYMHNCLLLWDMDHPESWPNIGTKSSSEKSTWGN